MGLLQQTLTETIVDIDIEMFAVWMEKRIFNKRFARTFMETFVATTSEHVIAIPS